MNPTKIKNRRTILTLAGMLLMILSGCGGGSGSTTPASLNPGGPAASVTPKFWGAVEQLEATDNYTGSPKIDMTADGSFALAVWMQKEGAIYDIWASRFDGANWGPAEKIETDDTGSASTVEIAVAADGSSAIAVWYQTNGSRYSIWANRFDGTNWGTAEKIETDDAGDARYPQIAIADDGSSAIAVWYQSDGTRTNIWANRFNGTNWGVAEEIETDDAGDARDPQVALADDGSSAMAVWHQTDGTRYNIWANRFDGTNWAVAEKIEAEDAGSAEKAQISMAADGSSAMAVWAQDDGTRDNIWANHFDGTNWGTAEKIEVEDGGNGVAPQIAMTADGSLAMAIWYQLDGVLYDIWANRFDGTNWGTAERIEAIDEHAMFPKIAMANDGSSAMAVWKQIDSGRYDIWANRFDGTSWETPEKIENEGGSGTNDPRITIAADGSSAMAVWSYNDGTQNNIRANRYE